MKINPFEEEYLLGKKMSLAECRLSAPELRELSDDELLNVRDQIYYLAQLALEVWWENHADFKKPSRVLTEDKNKLVLNHGDETK